MSANRTPGDWFFNRETWTIRSRAFGKSDQMGDYRGVVIAGFTEAHGNRPHSYNETEANARLMAASKELLASLQDVMKIVMELYPDGDCVIPPGIHDRMMKAADVCHKVAGIQDIVKKLEDSRD